MSDGGPELVSAGVVSYLNARPLVDALHPLPGWRLHAGVPAALLGMLETHRVDLALVPVVDLARRADLLSLVSDACIASDGPVKSVMVYSRKAISGVRTLAVDADSHTSVVLAQLIWRRRFGCTLDLTEHSERPEAQLLIGDKAVTAPPPDMPHSLDLGQAWTELTGLPMVYAAWVCRHEAFAPHAIASLGRTLSQARDEGERRAATLAREHAGGYGWPTALAEEYLTTTIKYRLDHRTAAGMRRFLHDAREARLL